MTSPLVEIGVGGTFAILVIREVFNFINQRRRNGHNDRRASNGTSGEKSTEYWQQTIAGLIDRCVTERVSPVLRDIQEKQYQSFEYSHSRLRELSNQVQALLIEVARLRDGGRDGGR